MTDKTCIRCGKTRTEDITMHISTPGGSTVRLEDMCVNCTLAVYRLELGLISKATPPPARREITPGSSEDFRAILADVTAWGLIAVFAVFLLETCNNSL